VISELNKNDNFTSENTICISLSLYFTPFRCRRHMKTSSLKRKNRRYLASCTLQFGSNLTKIIFQVKHFNYFIVVVEWLHVFWSDTHYSISLRYTRNIMQLNSFYIKFDSKHFFCIYIINTITNWRVSLSKICHEWPNNTVTHECAQRMSELQRYLVMSQFVIV
jgi:hypothetical protein